MASSGNFCTLNPLTENDSRMSQGNYSNGNLTYDDVGGDGWICNMAMTHKTYCEFRVDGIVNYGGTIGLRGTQAASQTYDSVTFQANYSSGNIYHYKGSTDQSFSGNAGGTVSSGNIVMMAYDPATYKWWVGVNGSWNGSQDPANGSNPCFTGSATMFENMNVTWGGWSGDVNRLDHTWNFGQDSTFAGQETAGGNADENGFGDFKYTPPTGFLALCTGNMVISDDIDPAQTDDDYPAKQFNVVTYTGNGGVLSVTGLGFKPDLVWGKMRSPHAYNNMLYDSSRGANKVLQSDTTNAQIDISSANTGLRTFDSDGFTLGSEASLNDSGDSIVAWCWRANGGTTATNDEGSLDSTVQANTKAGFSIVETPNFSGSCTLGHGLTKAPEFVIHKLTASGNNWNVWHTGLSGAGNIIRLNTYAAETTGSHFNSTAPTADVFSMGASLAGSGVGICYLWHSVDGYSKFGKYEGNGNSDNAFIYTGFRPRMAFFKNIDSDGEWTVFDTARQTYNEMTDFLEWDQTAAEKTQSGTKVDFLSNGMKVRGNGGRIGGSATYIYGAWGDVSFKYGNTF